MKAIEGNGKQLPSIAFNCLQLLSNLFLMTIDHE
jgi:hypothetical protein